MRALLVATLILVAALAGCSGKKDADEELHYRCANGVEIHEDDYEDAIANLTEDSQIIDFLKTKCPKSGGSGGSKSNTTSLAPNLPPILKINVTDSGGNATRVTLVDGNLTFSAEGSSDPDGQISAIAITVKDANQTRTKSLYNAETKKFTPATFTFDRAGPVNVSIAMVDDRAGFTTNMSQVYVNMKINLVGATLYSVAPAYDSPGGMYGACTGARGAVPPESHTIVDSTYYNEKSFTVEKGAVYIEMVPGEDTDATICSFDLTTISDGPSNDPQISTPDTLAMPPKSTDNYYIGMYTTTPNTVVSALVTVHYDPKPAAAAA